ncbi:MAG TPA: peptidoglycan editing factor PgeF [Candidatus Cybelea sp.]|nr:peptidoglycan editing factor PgeF [Candidatus Cybelea sp.]
MTVPVLQSALLAMPGVRHGFFTRAGGVSGGVYASLNCGVGSRDDAAAVRENRRRAMDALGLPTEALTTLYQVHGDRVIDLTAAVPPTAERPKADGMVCATPGLALGILAADCVPVLLADHEARVIAACHAGWKGALAGIVAATVEAMRRHGAAIERIAAAIGPAIRQASYEVGPEFPAPFLAADAANARFFAPGERANHFQFDLTGFINARLAAAGIKRIDDVSRDTRAEPDTFFSYRRTTLAREPDYGRQLSAIALAP